MKLFRSRAGHEADLLVAARNLGAEIPDWDSQVVATCRVVLTPIPLGNQTRECKVRGTNCVLLLTNTRLVLLSGTDADAVPISETAPNPQGDFGLLIALGGCGVHGQAYSDRELAHFVKAFYVMQPTAERIEDELRRVQQQRSNERPGRPPYGNRPPPKSR